MQNNTAKHVKKQDAGYQSTGRRIRFALGPIFQLWKTLVKACKEKCSDAVDCNKLVRYVEQSVVCLGQASQTVDHHRRMAVLTRIIPKPKKCLEILARNDDVLKKNKELFVASFYTALHRHAKGNKKLREAKRELQGAFRQCRGQGQGYQRPFQERPPRASATNARGRGGPSRTQDRCVSKCVNTATTDTVKTTKSLCHTVSSPNTYGDQINDILEPIKNLNLADIKLQMTGGRLAAFLSNWCQITNDKWILNTIQSYAIEWIQKPVQSHWYGNPKIYIKKTRNDRPRSENTTRKRCKRTISKHTKSIHKSPILKTKTRWHNETCVQSNENEQNVKYEHFKMEGMPTVVDLLR